MMTKSKTNYAKYGYWFTLPFILAFLLFQLYPIVHTFAISFTKLKGWETALNFSGFDNYANLLHNQHFLKAFKNTWIIWAMNFIPQIIVALGLAHIMTDLNLKIRGAGLFKVAFYMPNIITAASVSILFMALFGFPSGPVNQFLQFFGVIDEPYNFFRSVWVTRGVVAFILFWMWYGQTFIILSAAIMGIDPSLYEAAMVDGASSRSMFFHITLPLIKPVLLYIFVTSLIGGMQMFDIPFLLTNGNPDYAVETMTMFIYKQAFLGSRNFYMAATASVALFMIVSVLSLVLFNVFGERDSRKKVVK